MLKRGPGLMQSDIVNFASLLIALTAVCVAIWQVRASSKSSELSNALPIISEIMHEWRSSDFRSDALYIIAHSPKGKEGNGFGSLPTRWRNRAYRVCYFFDYVGVLASLGIISDELVISMMGTRIMQIWQVLEPYIARERRFRAETYPPDVPPGFLVYFEHIVARVVELGGQQAAARIQQRTGLRRLVRPMSTPTYEPKQASVAVAHSEASEHRRPRWRVRRVKRGAQASRYLGSATSRTDYGANRSLDSRPYIQGRRAQPDRQAER